MFLNQRFLSICIKREITNPGVDPGGPKTYGYTDILIRKSNSYYYHSNPSLYKKLTIVKTLCQCHRARNREVVLYTEFYLQLLSCKSEKMRNFVHQRKREENKSEHYQEENKHYPEESEHFY
jgi:hypothetical protein